jgi:hypothetical protein
MNNSLATPDTITEPFARSAYVDRYWRAVDVLDRYVVEHRDTRPMVADAVHAAAQAFRDAGTAHLDDAALIAQVDDIERVAASYVVEHVEHVETSSDADAAAVAESARVEHVERVAYIERIAAVVALLRGWVAFLTYAPPLLDDALQARRADVANYAARQADADDVRIVDNAPTLSLGDLNYYADQVERVERDVSQRVVSLLDDIERAAADAAASLRIGTPVALDVLDLPTRQRALNYCHDRAGDAQTVTVHELLTVWQDIEHDTTERVRAVCRTLRAAATRHRWHDDYADAFDEIGDDLTMSAWRHTVDVPDALPLVLDDAPSVHQSTAPSRIEHVLTSDVATIKRGVLATIENYRTDLTTLGDHLHEMATGSHSHWCSEYETVAERMNGELRDAWYAPYFEPFRTREIEFYVNGTATISITIPVSTAVTARDESDAMSQADFDVDHYAIADALGVSAADVRGWNFDVHSVDVDDAERAE